MTVAIDFDGVIHAYRRGWVDGTIYDPPMTGALVSVELIMNRDSVFIHTSRNPRQVARWIEEQSGHFIKCTTRLPRTWWGRRKTFWNRRGVLLVTDRKLPANVYIDDRAYRFDSWRSTLDHLAIDPGVELII